MMFQSTKPRPFLLELTYSTCACIINYECLLFQAIESILFLLQGAASNITEETSATFRNVLSLFPRMPSNNSLIKTALKLLGTYIHTCINVTIHTCTVQEV